MSENVLQHYRKSIAGSPRFTVHILKVLNQVMYTAIQESRLLRIQKYTTRSCGSNLISDKQLTVHLQNILLGFFLNLPM